MYVQFAELPAFDQDRAKAFYADTFDCEVAADQTMSKDGWRWIELRSGGAETTLHFFRRGNEAPSAEPVLVFVDDDVEALSRGSDRAVSKSSQSHKRHLGNPALRLRSFGTVKATAS